LLVGSAALLTGVFSAGPSMAALLEVAEQLAQQGHGVTVYVGLAFGVCAGSSLFLTAATSGPLAQALAERARLRDGQGNPLVFGFTQHLAPGFAGFAVTLAAGLAYVVWR
jgi:Na+/H+ antiporter NhaD/arsenite permease-like protein